ncbi:MAG: ECF-type sigma factor [Phycisphaerales bacterium]
MVDEEGWSSDRLLELLYDERASSPLRIARLPPGSTLQPTALVHEGVLRVSRAMTTLGRGGLIFGAAARAMRNVLTTGRGARQGLGMGGRNRITLDTDAWAAEASRG